MNGNRQITVERTDTTFGQGEARKQWVVFLFTDNGDKEFFFETEEDAMQAASKIANKSIAVGFGLSYANEL